MTQLRGGLGPSKDERPPDPVVHHESDGKEGVCGSSPQEGFASSLQSASFVVCGGDRYEARRPPSVHGTVRELCGRFAEQTEESHPDHLSAREGVRAWRKVPAKPVRLTPTGACSVAAVLLGA